MGNPVVSTVSELRLQPPTKSCAASVCVSHPCRQVMAWLQFECLLPILRSIRLTVPHFSRK